ncbi:MAG: site-2 protease family protein [Phycisphaeraceae bacterium]
MLENSYIAVALFILGFGFLIFIHELGHFLAAKWVGIKCTQFAIGFGQALVSWRQGMGLAIGSSESTYLKRVVAELDQEDSTTTEPANYEERVHKAGDERVDAISQRLGLGETEYRLNYLPLGGYVKMVGQEDLDPTAVSKSPRSFNNKSIPARALVISAGVIMNLITGFVVFIPAFLAGVDFPAAEVGIITPDSPAAAATPVNAPERTDEGLKLGDRILTVDGKPVRDMVDVGISIALAQAGSERILTVDRPGYEEPLTFNVSPRPDARREGLLSIGIGPSSTLQLAAVTQDSLLEQSGITRGMTLSAVGDTPVDRFHELRSALDNTNGEPTTLTFTGKDGTTKDIAIQPEPGLFYDPQLAEALAIEPATRVLEVVEDSPAAKAGVKAGDLIARIGGTELPSLRRLTSEIESAGNTPMRLVVRGEDGTTRDLGTITPSDGRIGVIISPAIDSGIVGQNPDSATQRIPPGSKVDWYTLQRAIQTSTNQIEIPFQPTGEISAATVTFTVSDEELALLQGAGWRPPTLGAAFTELQTSLKADNVGQAIGLGLVKTGDFMAQTYLTLLRLFQGSVQVSNLRGPVGIVDEGHKVASRGWPYLLFFLGLISINLAVLNFLPLPIVDGGLMIFLLIEAIRGKPASARIQQGATLAGLALLGCLFIFVTFNDLWRLIFA